MWSAGSAGRRDAVRPKRPLSRLCVSVILRTLLISATCKAIGRFWLADIGCVWRCELIGSSCCCARIIQANQSQVRACVNSANEQFSGRVVWCKKSTRQVFLDVFRSGTKYVPRTTASVLCYLDCCHTTHVHTHTQPFFCPFVFAGARRNLLLDFFMVQGR